jgi:hypothetical protein
LRAAEEEDWAVDEALDELLFFEEDAEEELLRPAVDEQAVSSAENSRAAVSRRQKAFRRKFFIKTGSLTLYNPCWAMSLPCACAAILCDAVRIDAEVPDALRSRVSAAWRSSANAAGGFL